MAQTRGEDKRRHGESAVRRADPVQAGTANRTIRGIDQVLPDEYAPEG